MTLGTVAKASQDLDEDATDATDANAFIPLFNYSRPTRPPFCEPPRNFLIAMDSILGSTLLI